MGILIPIGSGKGGVGKTVFAANLGAALSAAGRTVILVDLDLGGANLHTCLGVRNKNPGVGSLVWKKEKHLEALVIATRLAASAADAGTSGGDKALAELCALRPRVVVNMGAGAEDADIAQRLREISARNLGIGMEYIAYIMRDPAVSQSLNQRAPLVATDPDCLFSRGAFAAAERILHAPAIPAPGLQLDDEDLYSIIEKAILDKTPEQLDA